MAKLSLPVRFCCEFEDNTVVFMDADDVLHPSFVLTHVYVHLSSRAHPGLSSSDIFQSVDGHIVVCTGEAMNDYIMAI